MKISRDHAAYIRVYGLRRASRMAVVDFADLERATVGGAWSVWKDRHGREYPGRWRQTDTGRIYETLGHVVLALARGERVTFADADPFNCRRANLRTKAFGSVRYRPEVNARNPWAAECWIRGQLHSCGSWPTEDMAREALSGARTVRDEAVAECWHRGLVRMAIDRAICRIRPRRRGGRSTVPARSAVVRSSPRRVTYATKAESRRARPSR